MGNCMHREQSVVASQDQFDDKAKPAESVISYDEATHESSSYATASPSRAPSPSPLAAAAGLTPAAAAMRHEASPNRSALLPKPRSLESSLTMDQQREEGQRRLRELVISGANAGEIDWKSIISLAEDLHRKEQDFLRSYNEHHYRSGNKNGRMVDSPRKNISRRQAFFEKRRRRKEMIRRKKLESVGSFSVNILSYDVDERSCQKQHVECTESMDASPKNEVEEAIESDEIDIYEDDDPSPLHHNETSTYPRLLPRANNTDRPGTPDPFDKSSADRVTGMSVSIGGSFMEATSLFNSVREDEELSSSSSSDSDRSISSVPAREDWDLITIDENNTVVDW